jgi:hypothetical protein
MACGCSKKASRSTGSGNRSAVSPRGSSIVPSVSQLRSPTNASQQNPGVLNAEQKRVQSLRRDAIRKALNK